MKTVWILARSLHSATQSLNKNLKDNSAFNEDFVSFCFIATADQINSLPKGESFLVVQKWRDRQDAEEVLKAIKEQDWQPISMRDVFLS